MDNVHEPSAMQCECERWTGHADRKTGVVLADVENGMSDETEHAQSDASDKRLALLC